MQERTRHVASASTTVLIFESFALQEFKNDFGMTVCFSFCNFLWFGCGCIEHSLASEELVGEQGQEFSTS